MSRKAILTNLIFAHWHSTLVRMAESDRAGMAAVGLVLPRVPGYASGTRVKKTTRVIFYYRTGTRVIEY